MSDINEEIKEILDMFTKYKDDWYSCEYKLKPKQCVILYDYITNLKQENTRLNNIIDELEKEMNRGYLSYIETQHVLDKLKELKGDNK